MLACAVKRFITTMIKAILLCWFVFMLEYSNIVLVKIHFYLLGFIMINHFCETEYMARQMSHKIFRFYKGTPSQGGPKQGFNRQGLRQKLPPSCSLNPKPYKRSDLPPPSALNSRVYRQKFENQTGQNKKNISTPSSFSNNNYRISAVRHESKNNLFYYYCACLDCTYFGCPDICAQVKCSKCTPTYPTKVTPSN